MTFLPLKEYTYGNNVPLLDVVLLDSETFERLKILFQVLYKVSFFKLTIRSYGLFPMADIFIPLSLGNDKKLLNKPETPDS